MTRRAQARPDYVVSPGAILEEMLEAREMTKADFAERCGRSPKFVSEVIAGKAPITHEAAMQFGRVLGIEADFWMNLESAFRLRLAEDAEAARFAEEKAWLKTFPLAEMARFGIVQKGTDVAATVRGLLSFFEAASVEALKEIFGKRAQQVAYRRSASFQGRPEAVMAWLQWGERLARKIECAEYDAGLFKRQLKVIRGLTRQDAETIQRELIPLCATAGVAVVFTPELTGTRLSGATRWIGDTPIIQLSLRHKSDDHLWFTFFHEAAHVLLHGKKGVFIDDAKADLEDPREQEANEFAAAALVPRSEFSEFVAARSFSRQSVVEFSDRIGISPGVVVGQLQHARLVPFDSALGKLKVRFCWAD